MLVFRNTTLFVIKKKQFILMHMCNNRVYNPPILTRAVNPLHKLSPNESV